MPHYLLIIDRPEIMYKDFELFNRIAHKLLESEKETGVVKPVPFDSLKTLLDLDLEEEAINDEQFEKALTDLVLNTPRTATTLFFNQLFGGRQSKATLGELLAVFLNNSMYTYKVGGPMIAMEKNILNKVGDEAVLSINLPSPSDDEINFFLTELKALAPNKFLVYFHIPNYLNVIIHLLPHEMVEQPECKLNDTSPLPIRTIKRWRNYWRHGL